MLRELFRRSIRLQESGGLFYALFDDGVAAALFDLAARPEEFPLENNGSGGSISLTPTIASCLIYRTFLSTARTRVAKR